MLRDTKTCIARKTQPDKVTADVDHSVVECFHGSVLEQRVRLNHGQCPTVSQKVQDLLHKKQAKTMPAVVLVHFDRSDVQEIAAGAQWGCFVGKVSLKFPVVLKEYYSALV